MAFRIGALYCHHVDIRCCHLLQRKGVGQLQAAIDREISLNRGEVDIVERPWRLRRLQWHDLDAPGILDDVEFGDIDRLAVANFDQAEVAQNPQCALQIDGIVGHGNRRSGFDRRAQRMLFRIESHGWRGYMDDAHQIGDLAFVVGIQKYRVLHDIGVDLALEYGVVRLKAG